MSKQNLQDMVEEIDKFRRSPADIQKVIVNTLEQVSNGKYTALDPTNPFIFLLEASAATGAAGLMQNERLLRNRYPSLAHYPEELYHHMSDADYLDRFSSPGKLTFTFLLAIEELKQRAIKDVRGIGHIMIPKDTEIEVEGYTFTFHYPIDIRLMPHGGLQVVYDTSEKSPMYTLESNQPDWTIVRMPGSAGDLAHVDILRIDMELEQLKLISKREDIDKGSGFTKTYTLNDGKFYHARVYVDRGGYWDEIHTTHSDLVYDPQKPTAKLRHLDDRIQVHIPQIYTQKQLIDRRIRIDIYTTQGDINHCFDRYEPRNFSARWRDLSQSPSHYNEPIKSFNTITIFADDCLRDGGDGIDFEQLRERVINNATGEIEIPITPAQLDTQTKLLGYDLEKSVDHLTKRVYTATRAMEAPDTSANIQSVIGLSISTIRQTAKDLIELDNVYDNGDRVTIASGTLFSGDGSIVQPLKQGQVDSLSNKSNRELAQHLNENYYLYNPFYYVLDMTRSLFDFRCYHLDQPKVSSKTFVAENESALIQASVHRYGLSKYDWGYKIAIETMGGDIFNGINSDQIKAFMLFKPNGEASEAFILGTYLGLHEESEERIFEFDIETNYDIDENDNLYTTNFQISSGSDTPYAVGLEHDFDIVIAVTDPWTHTDDLVQDDVRRSGIDDHVPQFLINERVYGLIQERLHINFGSSLKHLWRRFKTVAGILDYKRYEGDVAKFYEETVYERDENGLIVIDYTNGNVNYNILHNQGDPVLDGQGEQVYKARKGDIKLDSNGDPIPINERDKKRELDMLLFEGAFLFADDNAVSRYVKRSTDKIVEWVNKDMDKIQQRLLENTQVWFRPQTTIGDVWVTVEDGIDTNISSEQSLIVTYYLTESRHRDASLREELTQICVEEINAEFQTDVVSINSIINRIRERAGEEIIDVNIYGLGGVSSDYRVLTIRNKGSRLGIRKSVNVLSDDTLSVSDDVTINFLRHSRE